MTTEPLEDPFGLPVGADVVIDLLITAPGRAANGTAATGPVRVAGTLTDVHVSPTHGLTLTVDPSDGAEQRIPWHAVGRVIIRNDHVHPAL